jgi:hypothetical protein
VLERESEVRSLVVLGGKNQCGSVLHPFDVVAAGCAGISMSGGALKWRKIEKN